jgi:hypothetical protein
MAFPTRRTFLQATLAAAASRFRPRALLTRGTVYWFLHPPSGDAWPVDDPVAWCLRGAGQPLLERARARLATLDAADPQRVIRLVVRRCRLNLLELRPGRVVVHFWGTQGQTDLRHFFKTHGLAKRGVQVALIDRKQGLATVQTGDTLLYGEQLAEGFPLRAYLDKWRRRAIEEPDDWAPAPHTWSGFAWDGVAPNRIPWGALKSAWRRAAAPPCLNCGRPALLSNFGCPWGGLFRRRPRFRHVCGACRRMFAGPSVRDVPGWLAANLDAAVWPDQVMVWGRRRAWAPPGGR